MNGSIAALVAVVSPFAAASYGKAEESVSQRFPVQELASACAAAEADFRPVTEADLQEVKAELIAAVARLDERLRADGQNGEKWRKYLQWHRMQSQLQGDREPDLAELYAVYKKYRAQHDGLKLIWFADVRQSLRRYRLTARSVGQPKVRTDYENLLRALPAYIEAYHAEPTAELAVEIGSAIRWLEERRQAPSLVAGLRRELGRPNLWMEVSAEVLAAGIAGPVDDTEPIRDFILGTDIRGTGHTIGTLHVELVPDAKRGVFDTILLGSTRSRTVGYNGPARIHSTGTTGIGATKRLWINAQGLAELPAVSHAKTRSHINCIQTKRGSRLVQRIAWRRARSQQAQAERIAARHAEQRVNRRMNQQAAEMIDRANQSYLQRFRRPLWKRRLFPQRLDFSTTEDALHVVGVQADPTQLGAPAKPPKLTEPADLTLRVHESMLNNIALTALAGTLLTEEAFLAFLEELQAPGEMLARAESADSSLPWRIAFDPLRPKSGPRKNQLVLPVCVTFANGRLTVTIRGRRYYTASQDLPALDMVAQYKFEKTRQGFKAIRQGKLKVTRPNGRFAGKDGDILRRRFEGLFEEEILLDKVALPAEWAKAGRMKPTECLCEDGWLAIGWKRVSSVPPGDPDP